jgi:hypothetical protein
MFSKEFQHQYLKEVGIEGEQQQNIREAYETGHRIREFEIELYWKRTAYIWAMQAALIGIVMFIRTGGETTVSIDFLQLTSSTKPTAALLAAILLVSTLAFVIACLWYLLIKGAKFWQDNRERHVDLLGEALGQNLYQVYPIQRLGNVSPNGEIVAPFSVTKINSYVVCAFIWFWILNLVWALWELSTISASLGGIHLGLVFLGWIALFGAIALFFCVQFRHSKAYNGLRMSRLGEPIAGLPNGPNDPALYTRKVNRS